MATNAKKTTTRKAPAAKKTTSVKETQTVKDEKIEETVEIEETNNEVTSVKEKREFHDTDLIPCLNVYPGAVGMTGRRTGNAYFWEDMGVVEYVEYKDLKSEVLNRSSAYIYEPLIMVTDDDFLQQNPRLEKMYNDFYTPSEIMDKMANSDPENMRNFIEKLPSGIKTNIKNIAATMIHDGTLDSVKKIKIIDEIFGTELSNLQF